MMAGRRELGKGRRAMDEQPQDPALRRAWPTWVQLLLTAVMGLGLVGLLASHPRSAPRWQRTECANHLRQIALALHDYHQVYGCLPPAHVDGPGGKPMHSWRVLILPFLHYEKLYQQYDFAEPWNGPKNSLLAKRIPHEYRCPAAQEANSWATSYVAVVGPATAWPGSKCVRFQDIKDGTSDTILLVEVADATIPWMEPRDMRFERRHCRSEYGPAPRDWQPSSRRSQYLLGRWLHQVPSQQHFARGDQDASDACRWREH